MEVQAYLSMATLRNALDQSKVGGEIIQQTLQEINKIDQQNAQANQNPQNAILQANYDGRGTVINKLV
jgi:hypothetical protein